ncbi:FxLD family lanthipeptide [Streptomyces sp. NPDC051172]
MKADDDPFGLDITFIEGTPATETVLMCSTGDTCGSSCPSACTTS